MQRALYPVLLIALFLVGCDQGSPLVGPASQNGETLTSGSSDLDALSHVTVADGEYILTAGRWNKAQQRAVEAAGGTVTFSHKKAGVAVATSSNPNFIDEVMASDALRSAAPNVMVQWQPPVRHAKFDEQAVTPGDESFFDYQWNMLSMQAPEAWAEGATGAGARVAVIDGGIDDDHVDLEANLDKQCSASFVPGQDYNTDTGTFWHGTHVAGIVAAADNGLGVIGVAPEATLMHAKALHDGSGAFAWVIAAILFAADPGSFPGYEGCERADIINMSLGALFPKNAEGAGPLVAALNKAVNFAGSKGVLVISSAGNSGLDMGQTGNLISVPAQSGSGIAIAATGPVDFANGGDAYRTISSYSNYGEDLVFAAAPGGDFTLYPVGLWYWDMVLSTNVGDVYTWAAGTSMASPAAAGVAALIVGENPGISTGALKAKLKNTADDEGKVGNDEYYGHGFVNAYNAVTQ